MSTKSNPANEKKTLPPNFRPMSGGQLRLDVPEREGFHRHWIRGTYERLQRAQQAGYTFVGKDDVSVNNFDLGGDPVNTGSTDLGTRVSVATGEVDPHSGSPVRLFLMECPLEYYEASRLVDEEKVDRIASAITNQSFAQSGSGETYQDVAKKYVKGVLPSMFTRKTNRSG